MNAELAIFPDGGAVCAVLLEDGQPAEWLRDEQQERLHRLDIVLGLVRQVTPALKCAFVDIGEPHDAMLPLGEAQTGIKSGQRVLVQIRREAPPGKGHQVTGKIQLPGPYAVFNSAGAPKKRSKLADFELARQQELFTGDLRRLEKRWAGLQADSQTGPAPRLLLAAGDPLTVVLTSLVSGKLTRIRVEGGDLFQHIYGLVEALMPEYLPALALFVPDGGYGLAAVLGVGNLQRQLAERKVWLENGGFLLIDRTGALTVIDVNSGKDIRGRDSGELRRRTNQLAAEAIVRQIRLRNIGGMIVIDFIHVADLAEQADLLECLKSAVRRDRARCELAGFTRLGLFELTRTAL